MSDNEGDRGSWRARCDRYFTSLTDSDTNGEKESKGDNTGTKGNKSGEKETWKSLSELKKQTKERRGYTKRLLSVLDIHGTRVCGSTNNVYECMTWLFIILASVSALAYLVYLQIDAYNSHTSHFETLDIETFAKTETPLVSFCNRNILRKSTVSDTRFADLAHVDLETIALSNNTSSQKGDVKNIIGSNKKLNELLAEAGYRVRDAIVAELEDDIISRGLLQSSNISMLQYLALNGRPGMLLEYLEPTLSEIRLLGHKSKDMIVKCFLGGRACKDSELEGVTHNKFGNCLTITPSDMRRSGTLEVILDVENGEYLDFASPSVGVNVIVHHGALRSTSTIMKSSTSTATPNTHVDIDILEETLLTRLDDRCSPGKEFNQKQACLEACANSVKENVCGCRPLSAEKNQSIPICRNDVVTEYLCVRVIDEIQQMNRLKCNCREKCSETSYTTKSSVLVWPSEQHIKYLQSQLKQLRRNMDPNYIRNNLVKVSVTLRPQLYQQIKEKEHRTLLDILAMVGGLSALIVGVSVMTIVELLWIAIKTIWYFAFKCCRRNDVKKVHKLSDSDITSITWAMHRLRRREEELRKERETKNQKKSNKTDQNVFTGNVQRHIARRNNYLAPATEGQESVYANVKDTTYEKLNVKRHPDKEQEAFREHRRMSDNSAHRHGHRNLEVPNYDYVKPSYPRLMRVSRKAPDNSDTSRSNMMHLEGIYRPTPASHQIYYERVTYPHVGRLVTPADAIQLYGGQYFHSNQISDPVYI